MIMKREREKPETVDIMRLGKLYFFNRSYITLVYQAVLTHI